MQSFEPGEGAAPLRSQPTRDRILTAAREVFAREGYERATVRAVAAAAGCNPALVIRYYGSKDGLFAVAAEFDLRLPDLRELPADGWGEQLVAHFLQRWEGPESRGELQALLRASASHPAARQRLQSIFQDQLAPAIASLDRVDQPAARTGLVASQMLGLALGRYILQLPGLVAIRRDQLITALGATLQGYLVGPLPGP